MKENLLTIGEKIREIRKEKALTIHEVAQETGFTSSFISQFERNLTQGSVASIQKIANALDIPVSILFQGAEVENESENNSPQVASITRKNQRPEMAYPDGRMIDYLLTGKNSKLEVLYSVIEPGGGSGNHYAHESEEECIIILKGQMEVSVDKSTYILNEGDSINFSSRLPHAWRNLGDEKLEVIWINTPINS